MRSVNPPSRCLASIVLTLTFILSAPIARAQDLPTGKAVLDRYIEATGGRAAYEAIESSISKVTLNIPAQNIKGNMTIYQQAPDKGKIETEIVGIGKEEAGYDGNVAWQRSGMMGVRVLDGQERESIVRSLTIGSELHPEKFYTKIETAGTEDVEGKPAYKLELTTNAGAKETRWYDKESALLVKTESTQKTQMGEMKVTGTPGEYATYGQIKMPRTVTQSMMGQQFTLTIEDVQHNAEIPQDKLELPEDVKKLAEKQQGGAGGAGAPATQPGK